MAPVRPERPVRPVMYLVIPSDLADPFIVHCGPYEMTYLRPVQCFVTHVG